MSKSLLVSFILVAGYLAHDMCVSAGRISPTKIECTAMDNENITIQQCEIKEKSPGINAIYLNVTNRFRNVYNLTYNVQLFKKQNGAVEYEPFLYNLTGDICETLKGLHFNPFLKTLYDILVVGTNLNHDCPFNHDFIIHDYTIADKLTESLSLMSGDYMAKVHIGAYNAWKFAASVYVTLLPKS